MNASTLRDLLVEAERQNRDIASPALLDIDAAVDAILNGEVDLAAAETESTDEAERLVNACILSDGRWWVQ